MKILIVYGGFGLSSESNVSKMSGKEVFEACKKIGIDVQEFELNKDNIDLLKSEILNYDIVFPVLHGAFGEDSQIQKILDDSNISYIGSGSESSKLCFNKMSTKELLEKNHINTPKWKIVKNMEDVEELEFPVVLKPICGGSSLGIEIFKNKESLMKFNITEPFLAEEYIEGREITIGILGNEALPVIEIIPPKEGWFDYKNKYSGSVREIVSPDSIDIRIQKEAQKLALDVHALCDCRHLSRVDMLLRDNKLYVLEINTMPGMTSKSLYPKAAQAVGLDMEGLISKLLSLT